MILLVSFSVIASVIFSVEPVEGLSVEPLPPVVVFPAQDERREAAPRVRTAAIVIIIFFISISKYAKAVKPALHRFGICGKINFRSADIVYPNFMSLELDGQLIFWNNHIFLEISLNNAGKNYFRGCEVCRTAAFILCFCMSFWNLSITSHFAQHSEQGSAEAVGGRIFLTSRECENDEIEVSLSLESEYGIAAFFGEIIYDPDELLYLGSESGECELALSAADLGGCVRILSDGVKNSEKSCVLSRLRFKKTGNRQTTLTLSGNGDEYAFFFDEKGNLQPFTARLEGCTISEKADCEIKDGANEASTPRLLNFEPSVQDDGVDFCFEIAAPSRCFAAGIKLFVVDLERGTCDAVYIVGIVANGLFSGKYRFNAPNAKRLSVVITPISFDRLGEKRGAKTVNIIQ